MTKFTKDARGTVRWQGRRITISGLLAIIESNRSVGLPTGTPKRLLRDLAAFLGIGRERV